MNYCSDGPSWLSQLLFTDNTVPAADSEKLFRLMSKFGRMFERRKLRVGVY